MSPQEIRSVLATFPHWFEVGEDENGVPRLAFIYEPEGMSIHDPLSSSCGRFKVAPAEYGLSQVQVDAFIQLDKEMAMWADTALHGLASQVQSMIGVTSGDRAALHFSDDKEQNALLRLALEYLVTELEEARAAHVHQPADAGGPEESGAPSAGG